jgi:hypothetical protein
MDSNGVLAFVRKLCDDIDASRPVRYGMRSVLVPFAVPAALGLGVGLAGCGDSSPIDDPDEVCDNGLDDDDNGAIDCDDSACAEDEGCLSTDPPCEPRTEYCEDGFDNDGNGETDCADLCCDAFCFARDCPMCAYGVPFQPLENEADCGDDQDEDCDGQRDCCDPDCERDPLCAE